MKIGDIVSVISCNDGVKYFGVILELYFAKDPDGEVKILWSDGKIHWERVSCMRVAK